MVEPMWPAPMTTTCFMNGYLLLNFHLRVAGPRVDFHCKIDEMTIYARRIAEIFDHMDDIDTRLIAALREDARAPAAALARTLGLSRTTVQSRLERLERQGVVAGYTVRL